MQIFRVKNFEQFQHYKDRSPPWIKLYNALLDDYSFACLQDASKLHLILIWLLASRSDNKLPYDGTWIAKRINATSKVDLDVLVDAGFILIDQELRSMEHGASSALADCKQAARPERERETETEVEAEREKIGEPNGSGAEAPSDPRKDLFGRGLKVLAEITGKTPDSCRSLVGKWLKAANDEAIHVLAAIEDAQRNRIADPTAWITRVLTNAKTPNGYNRDEGKAKWQDALRKLGDYAQAPNDGDVRPTALRLLPTAGRGE